MWNPATLWQPLWASGCSSVHEFLYMCIYICACTRAHTHTVLPMWHYTLHGGLLFYHRHFFGLPDIRALHPYSANTPQLGSHGDTHSVLFNLFFCTQVTLDTPTTSLGYFFFVTGRFTKWDHKITLFLYCFFHSVIPQENSPSHSLWLPQYSATWIIQPLLTNIPWVFNYWLL